LPAKALIGFWPVAPACKLLNTTLAARYKLAYRSFLAGPAHSDSSFGVFFSLPSLKIAHFPHLITPIP